MISGQGGSPSIQAAPGHDGPDDNLKERPPKKGKQVHYTDGGPGNSHGEEFLGDRGDHGSCGPTGEKKAEEQEIEHGEGQPLREGVEEATNGDQEQVTTDQDGLSADAIGNPALERTADHQGNGEHG